MLFLATLGMRESLRHGSIIPLTVSTLAEDPDVVATRNRESLVVLRVSAWFPYKGELTKGRQNVDIEGGVLCITLTEHPYHIAWYCEGAMNRRDSQLVQVNGWSFLAWRSTFSGCLAWAFGLRFTTGSTGKIDCWPADPCAMAWLGPT